MDHMQVTHLMIFAVQWFRGSKSIVIEYEIKMFATVNPNGWVVSLPVSIYII